MTNKPGSPAPIDPVLLQFEPVVRKVKRPDGWTPDLQRQLIALLAQSGSVHLACTAMNKHATGAEALYKVPSAHSFRAAWDAAVAIGRRRSGLDAGPPHLGPVPGITRRQPRPPVDPDDGFPDPVEGEAISEDAKLELVERLIAKFQRKVGLERECRLAGRVVEADFTLRQITALEVAFDLMVDGLAFDGWQMLMEARRGGRNMLEIADTQMARILDQARRDHWAAMDEPGRPELWPERYVTATADGSGDRTEPLEALGPASTAPAGIDPDAWKAMSYDEQKAAQEAQYKRDAEEQVKWEARSAAEAAEWRAAQDSSSPGSPGEGNQP
jgi:hypothetical protein